MQIFQSLQDRFCFLGNIIFIKKSSFFDIIFQTSAFSIFQDNFYTIIIWRNIKTIVFDDVSMKEFFKNKYFYFQILNLPLSFFTIFCCNLYNFECIFLIIYFINTPIYFSVSSLSNQLFLHVDPIKSEFSKTGNVLKPIIRSSTPHFIPIINKNVLLSFSNNTRKIIIFSKKIISSRMTLFYKVIAFVATFLGYASLHSMREGWAFSKQQITNEFGVSKNYLGIVDALYMLSYSGGMVLLGNFTHRVTLKNYVIFGLVLSSVCYMSFAVVYGLTSFFSVVFLTIFMCLNGMFQAAGWPGFMGLIGNWFQKNKKGVLMGVWAMNANAGNIIGVNVCNLLQNNHVSWVFNFIVTGCFPILVALLIFFCLKQKPEQIVDQQRLDESLLEPQEEEGSLEKIVEEQKIQNEEDKDEIEKPQNENHFKYGVFSAICLPRVPYYLIGYACLKGCIYGLLFWLPTFFENKGLGDQKGYISSMVDIGSLVGGTVVGFLSDYYNKRAIFLSPLLFVCSFVMFMVSFALGTEAWQYYVAMFLIGSLFGGPYNIIGTVIAIDIGNSLKGGGTNVTKISSLIEGSGSLFTAISMIAIPYIPFDYLFYLFALESIIASLVILPIAMKEVKDWRLNKMKEIHQTINESQTNDLK